MGISWTGRESIFAAKTEQMVRCIVEEKIQLARTPLSVSLQCLPVGSIDDGGIETKHPKENDCESVGATSLAKLTDLRGLRWLRLLPEIVSRIDRIAALLND